MLTAGLIDDFLDGAQTRIAAAFHNIIDPWFGWLFDPMLVWYSYGVAIFAVVVVIGWFFPFKWIRAGLGFLLMLVGAFIAGGKIMHDKMKAQAARKRK